MTTSMALTARSFLLRLALAMGAVLFFAMLSRAGGPKCVAGTSYFDTTMTGQPLVWPQGAITYYTDQGDLSPALPNATANALVADAFSQWTAIPTAAIAATSGGQLAEDVKGSNVTVNSDGTISIPADIQSTATSAPVGIVYDYDGSVTDALMGSGAGNASQCFFNATFGGNNNYGSLATYQHALVVINGQCAQAQSQVVDVEYRLVRLLGEVLGLGWSQLNPNVLTGTPPPTSDDYAGFPVMHFKDPRNCVPITDCYPNPYQPAMDDMAAISRLYPVTAQNLGNFPGKQIFSAATARIHGSVWFTDSKGNRTQPMQGVNVVARWIDPKTNLPSRRYAASSVSGFLFTGNAGNPITGLNDATGEAYSQWGSTNATVEGFFDLAGLQLPNGGSAQYQLSVEPLDSIWSTGVGPYGLWLVSPSGTSQPAVVTIAAGQDVQQDILMKASAQPLASPASSWTVPVPLPAAGDWMGTISGYGDLLYLALQAQTDRTLSVAVTALDESGAATTAKAQPVIGMWAASDAEGTVPSAFTPGSFNTLVMGLTRLDAQVATSTNFLIGISDIRGDGRPDYRYQAHVLYGDSVSPPRVGVSGGPVTVQGIGFAPGLKVSVGGIEASILAVSASQIVLAAPVFGDGIQNITISDPVSGASSVMTGVLPYGAASTDKIVMLSSVNPSTPVGTQAPNPMQVRVLAADGVTPVAGATVGWTGSNSLQLSACGAASSCTVTTDQSGDALSWLTPGAVGQATITATLAPGAYTTSPSVSTTLNGVESTSDIGVVDPYIYIAQGATVGTLLTARVLSNGAARSNVTVNFKVAIGTATLSAASGQTNANGNATIALSVVQFAALAQITACVAPTNAPCQTFYVYPVALANLQLQSVAGAGQITAGQAFQPVVMRVTDSASPPNSVLGATVTFLTTVLRPVGGGDGPNSGDPVILSVAQSNATSDINGVVSIVPSSGDFSAPLEVDVAGTAGTSARLDDPLEVLPGTTTGGKNAPPLEGAPVRRPVETEGRALR